MANHNIIPPIQGVCDCCGKDNLVQGNFNMTRESYEERGIGYNYNVPYEYTIEKFSACHKCFVGGESGQFDDWTDEEKLYFWNTGIYLEVDE